MICAAPFVIDGDTLALDRVRVRLFGIDAAELGTPAGERAAAWLRSKLRGRRVCCRARYTDRYGRIVGICYVSRRDIARNLICSGHAREWLRYSRGYYRGTKCPQGRP